LRYNRHEIPTAPPYPSQELGPAGNQESSYGIRCLRTQSATHEDVIASRAFVRGYANAHPKHSIAGIREGGATARSQDHSSGRIELEAQQRIISIAHVSKRHIICTQADADIPAIVRGANISRLSSHDF
jgi:hypothetical protein